MFVEITDWRGEQVPIDPSRVIKIRPAGHADEPKKTVFIDYVSGGTFADDKLLKIVNLFGAHIRLAPLHAPDDTPVFINSDGIASIEVDKNYAGKCVAIVNRDFENIRVQARNRIALKETAAQARRIIESAKLDAEDA
jgi:hypothetical protein